MSGKIMEETIVIFVTRTGQKLLNTWVDDDEDNPYENID
jgi:hypothetical protein